MQHDKKYHDYSILSIWSGKTTLTKKFNKNLIISKFQFPTQLDYQDQMKLMEGYHFVTKKEFEA